MKTSSEQKFDVVRGRFPKCSGIPGERTYFEQIVSKTGQSRIPPNSDVQSAFLQVRFLVYIIDSTRKVQVIVLYFTQLVLHLFVNC